MRAIQLHAARSVLLQDAGLVVEPLTVVVERIGRVASRVDLVVRPLVVSLCLFLADTSFGVVCVVLGKTVSHTLHVDPSADRTLLWGNSPYGCEDWRQTGLVFLMPLQPSAVLRSLWEGPRSRH